VPVEFLSDAQAGAYGRFVGLVNRPGLVGDSWPWKHKDGVHANRSHSGEADDASVFD
jgi:hypothetical protein